MQIIQLAEAWGIAPWELVTDDPERNRWVRRGLIYRRMLAQAEAAATKRLAAKNRRR